MTEPKLLTADELRPMLTDFAMAHPFSARLLESHIAALQSLADAGADALRVVADIEWLIDNTPNGLYLSRIRGRVAVLHNGNWQNKETLAEALSAAVAAKGGANADHK